MQDATAPLIEAQLVTSNRISSFATWPSKQDFQFLSRLLWRRAIMKVPKCNQEGLLSSLALCVLLCDVQDMSTGELKAGLTVCCLLGYPECLVPG